MAHNGYRAQLNLWFLNFGEEHAFINYVKQQTSWTLGDNSGIPLPSTLDSLGYPTSISNDGVYGVFFVPPQAKRPGNYVCKWQGELTVGRLNFSHNLVSGSVSGVNGRFVVELTGAAATAGAIDIGITAINGANPITDYAFMHEDDEDLYDDGEIFQAQFLDKCSKFGVIRFLDWQLANTTSVAKWAHRKPNNYAFYASREFRASLYRGTTTNIGDAYSINLGDGGTPVDKDVHIIKFNSTSTGTSPTINGKALIGPASFPIDALSKPLAGKTATIMWDADLNAFLVSGGDTSQGDVLLANAVPFEVMLHLCKQTGAHPWFHVPYLALDPPTDFALELATFIKAYTDNPSNSASWMVPRFEAGNEVWNGAAGFFTTPYGIAKAVDRWGGSLSDASRVRHWHGRVLSLMGETISGVYGDDRSKYWVVCGVQTMSGSAASNDARMSGDHVSVDAGDPASDWVTRIACANYFNPTTSYTDEFALARAYSGGDLTAPATYVAACLDDGLFGVDAVKDAIEDHRQWALGYDLPITYYEGGYSPDFFGFDYFAPIAGATKAAQCVLTVTPLQDPNGNDVFPPAGSSVSISGVGGMTELNGNTYSVVSYSDAANTITINVNSTGFTTYTSGGTASFVNNASLRNDLRAASKSEEALYSITRVMNTHCAVRGSYPSAYVLSGNSAWAKFFPTAYDDATREWDAYEDFSTGVTPLRFTVVLA